jgi:CheY-like chemotaxis protein
VILMSAFDEPGAHTRALAEGARVFLRKPMPLPLLDAVLSSAVGGAGTGGGRGGAV